MKGRTQTMAQEPISNPYRYSNNGQTGIVWGSSADQIRHDLNWPDADLERITEDEAWKELAMKGPMNEVNNDVEALQEIENDAYKEEWHDAYDDVDWDEDDIDEVTR